ncbi:MAG: energy transducer TonB [Bacteroidales bacterium]|nr:energy transducer TonB [Bacteroidales bacterium]
MNLKICLAVLFCHSVFSISFAQETRINNGYEKGSYKGEYKIGIWQYYDSTGTLELEIDYTNAVLKYIQPDTSDYIIYKNGEWVNSKLDIPPVFIGSSVEFYDILNTNIDYPMQAWYRDLVGKVWISFEVDTTGRAKNYTVHNDIGGECAHEFLRVLKLIPNYWLVAEKDGKRFRSKLLIACEFGIIMDGKKLTKRKKKRNKSSLTLPTAKKIDGINYTIKKGYNPK